jgi:peptidoglycan/LPS O-acetylase OafA/YrhL
MRHLGHVAALDALRGIAILLVIGTHADSLVPGGALGVDLFFVLSGFLITSLLLSEWGRTGAVGLGSFYRRRALRLLPALGLMLAIFVAASTALTLLGSRADLEGALRGAVYGIAYVVNIVEATNGYSHDGLQHLWSLGQEEQFYVLWPPVLVLALRLRVGPRAIALALAALATCFTIEQAALLLSDAPQARVLLAPDSHSPPILLGCLAGVVFSAGLVRRVPLTVASIWVGLGCAGVYFVGLDSFHAYAVGFPLFAVAATVVVLAAALHPSWWFVRLVNQRPLRWLGKISYGLYLWHWPIFFVVGWQLGLPLSIAVAALSYRYVELPFLRMKTRWTTRADRQAEHVPAPAVA